MLLSQIQIAFPLDIVPRVGWMDHVAKQFSMIWALSILVQSGCTSLYSHHHWIQVLMEIFTFNPHPQHWFTDFFSLDILMEFLFILVFMYISLTAREPEQFFHVIICFLNFSFFIFFWAISVRVLFLILNRLISVFSLEWVNRVSEYEVKIQILVCFS